MLIKYALTNYNSGLSWHALHRCRAVYYVIEDKGRYSCLLECGNKYVIFQTACAVVFYISIRGKLIYKWIEAAGLYSVLWINVSSILL